LRFWESQRPTPPPETSSQDSDPRIAEGDAMLAGMKQAAPELVKMHDDTGTSPTENQDLLGQHFRVHQFEGMADVRTYIAWWLECDMVPAYRHHRRVLRLLQWRCPPTRWNLKNPPDVFHLRALTQVYPDVRLVWTHRDPVRVLPSVCSLIATVRSIFSDRVDRARLGRAQLELWSEGIRRALAYRDEVGEDRFVDVRMRDLVLQPIETTGQAYDRLGLDFTRRAEERMRDWMAAHPQHKHGEHHYTLEQFGLDRDEVREAFRAYTTRFDLEGEEGGG